MPEYPWERRLGAVPGDAFRVWAPNASAVSVGDVELTDAGYGVWEGGSPEDGQDYVFTVDGTDWPDPASRWQPDGLRGTSRVVDTSSFGWTPFTPKTMAEQVIYEMHVGTFSPDGTFEGAIPYLKELADIGITAIEVMPIAEFPGARGWGYDGVYLSAAQSSYGGPHAFARLVEAAHREGIAVILDVVYNHVGASGVTALEAYGPYFTEKYETPWGRAINYDDEHCDPVREWVLQSAEGWVRDFKVDGLRLDAIHAIFDSNAEHIVAAIARRVHSVNPDALVVAESGLNDPKVMRATEIGGYGCDAAWADDFHHSLRVLLTNDREGYYAEFGKVGDLAKAYHRPHVHDGVYSSFRGRRFGARADDVAPHAFVVFAQDHDQVGNRAYGDRLPTEARPLAAFATLLSPFTPMLFMGEEYGEDAPFQFFSDHIDEKIATATREGRRREFAAFAQFGEEIPDPQAESTMLASKLTRERNPELAELYARLIETRAQLAPGVRAIEFDEPARWMRVLRGDRELLMNFSDRAQLVPTEGDTVVLATHGTPAVGPEGVELEPLSGALIA